MATSNNFSDSSIPKDGVTTLAPESDLAASNVDLDKQAPDQDNDIFHGIIELGKDMCRKVWNWKVAFTDNAQNEKHLLAKRKTKLKGIKDDIIPPDMFPSIASPDVPADFYTTHKGDIDKYMKYLMANWYVISHEFMDNVLIHVIVGKNQHWHVIYGC